MLLAALIVSILVICALVFLYFKEIKKSALLQLELAACTVERDTIWNKQPVCFIKREVSPKLPNGPLLAIQKQQLAKDICDEIVADGGITFTEDGNCLRGVCRVLKK